VTPKFKARLVTRMGRALVEEALQDLEEVSDRVTAAAVKREAQTLNQAEKNAVARRNEAGPGVPPRDIERARKHIERLQAEKRASQRTRRHSHNAHWGARGGTMNDGEDEDEG
jgi:hypothetical protein